MHDPVWPPALCWLLMDEAQGKSPLLPAQRHSPTLLGGPRSFRLHSMF